MSGDNTQNQPYDEQLEAERLSLQATTPPTEIPGYRIEKFLGAGAFGQVWVGRDLNTGRKVAIKFYLHRGGVDWSLLAREVKHLVQLSADRHIVQVLEVGWDANPPFYVMEYLEFGSLEDYLASRPRLAVGTCVDMFRGICVGLNHSHGKGVLHCDLKPANILLDEELRPRLADFGQSRMSNEQTPALGTLFYMAPEQADLDAAPDVRWDVYALGAILYRMLTGNAPHRSTSLLQRIDTAASLPKRLEKYRQAIEHDGPPTDHHRRRGVDRSLAAIIDGCLAVDPEKRFANVQQVIEALDRRELAKERRPLVLLGIVGPLLLLLLTCVLTTRTIFATRATVESTLRDKAGESNALAAMFAARTLELELRKYFDVVQQEASTESLRQLCAEMLSDEDLAPLRERIRDDDGAAEARRDILDRQLHAKLTEYLRERLARYDGQQGGLGSIDLATMFITDASGTIISIAYEQPVSEDEDSVGKNFAYRAYFHGGRDDLPASSPPASLRPLHETHLSPAFFSTATLTWKVAVSTPVYLTPQTGEDQTPDAIFVATTNLGGFDLMRASRTAASRVNQVAALVDTRDGERRGTIIQHPLLNRTAFEANGGADVPRKKSPEDAPAVDQVTLDALLAGKDVDYLDPMGNESHGEDYGGKWVAAAQPVTLPRMGMFDSESESNLLVLVQYRWSDVTAPVSELVRRLMLYGALAVAGILAVIFLLWAFVHGASDESAPAGPQVGRPSGETETLPAT